MKTSVIAAALACVGSALASPWDGYQVLRVNTATDAAAASLMAVVRQHNLDTWTKPTRGGFADVVIPPHLMKTFKKAMNGYTIETMIPDLAVAVANSQVEEKPTDFSVESTQAVPSTWFDNYHAYADHLTFLNNLQADNPSRSRIVSSGKSYQGRDITGLHIYDPTSGPGKKPAVIWHGQVHAREWIVGPTVEYAAVQLLDANADAATKALTSKYEFYIFPFVNPDGFVYSQANSSTRLWRKNRQPPPSGSNCAGVDINRNWPYMWNVAGGSSTNPCDEDYRGPSAGSTPENKALTSFISGISSSQTVHQYIDFHSYSQLFMYPYGYTCNALPSNVDAYNQGAATFKNTVAQPYGTQYTTGPICKTIYPASGGSTDWAMDVAKVPFAWALELRDTGKYGFTLPANQIKPTAIETWGALKAVLTGGQ